MNPDYLKRLTAKAASLDWDAEVVELVRQFENAIKHDTFDRLAWEMLRDTIPNIPKAIRRLAEDFDYVAPAYGDLFYMLFQGDPEFVDSKEMLEGYDQNHPLMRYVQAHPNVTDLRGLTIFDEYNTAFSLLSLEDTMREAFERTAEARAAQQAAQELLDELRQQLQELLNSGVTIEIDGVPQQAEGPVDPRLCADLVTAVETAEQGLEDANARLEAESEAAAEGIGQAAGKAKEDLDQQRSSARAYGVEDGTLKRMSFEERAALVRRLDDEKMRHLADLLGAFREYADAERRRPLRHQPGAIHDVKAGDDLTNLVDDELIDMGIPELEDLFWLRWAEAGLLEWEERGIEKAGKGPIVVVCDESGSMDAKVDAKDNTREMWSKAVCLALCDQAKRQKRDFTYIGFSSGRQQWRIDFPGGHTPIEKVTEFVTHFWGGGTEYTTPLTMAIDLASEYEAQGRVKPDILFVTDDDCKVPDEFVETWNTARKRLDMDVYGVQIGGTPKQTMHKLCDKVIQLENLNAGPEGMVDLFRQI